MVIPTRPPTRARPQAERVPRGEPDLATLLYGLAAFLVIAAACLFLVAHAAR